MNDTVTLVIPSAPEFVGVARLTIVGIASRLGFSYEAVEDIRLAVAEACTGAILRTRGRQPEGSGAFITLRAWGDSGRMVVEIEDEAGPEAALESAPEEGSEELNENDLEEGELGELLIDLFMDEVSTEATERGTLVRLVKRNSDTSGLAA